MKKNFSDFLEEVESARSKLKCVQGGAFFRGHSQAHHKLVPTLLRNRIDRETEHSIYSECYARARRLMPENTNPWEFLSHMQHYGIPTRLLDWSESLASALYFAVKGDPLNPCIWVLNAYLLNKAARKKAGRPDIEEIIVPGVDPLEDYFDHFVLHEDQGKKEWPFKLPIFLDVPWASDRIAAQKGYFTFHENAKSLEEQVPNLVQKVEIPDSAIPDARKFLERAGVNEYTIFPDLEGFARHLKTRYFH